MADGVYRAGGNPGGSPTFSGASPDAFGAGVGRAIEEIGTDLERRQKLEKEQNRQNEAASAGVGLATVLGDTTIDVNEARDAAAPGGDGHLQAVTERLDGRIEKFLGGIKDERVRTQYRGQLAEYRGRVRGQEDAWQRGTSVDYRVNNLQDQGTTLANQQAVAPTTDGLVDAIEAIKTTWTQQELPDAIRTKGMRAEQRKVAVAWGNSMQLTNPQGLLNVLGDKAHSQEFTRYLQPEDIDRLRAGGVVEIRRQDAAEKARLAQGEATARESIRLFNARLSAGDAPTDQEFEATRQLAATYKLPVEDFNLAVAQSSVLINRETRTWTPQQFATSINDLRAKGDGRSQVENVRLKQLEAIQGSRVADFNNDPQGHAATIGNPAPALDLANPTSGAISARVTWAQGYARANGMVNPPYLSAIELKPFKDRVQQGPAGRLEVAQQLRATFGAAVGGRIAMQVEPNSKALLLAIGLPTTTSSLYSRGIDALGRNKALSDGEQEQEIFQEVAAAVPQDLRTPVFEAARAIAAGARDRANGAEFDEGNYRQALHLAMGATGTPSGLAGGIGYWNNAPIWLAPGMSQGEFQRRVSRATPQQMVAASQFNSAPRYWSNGKAGRTLTTAELRQLQFETVRPGVVRVKGPIGGYLTDGKGRPWTLDVGKLK